MGPTGPEAEQGVAGADGSTILSGTGIPGADVGKRGDYYLDNASANLYGPKTASGWPTPLNLKGPKGDAGPAGTTDGQMRSGEGEPTAETEKAGDFYFDKLDAALYGPKTASGWGVPISLKPATANGVKIVIIRNHRFQDFERPSSDEPDYNAGRFVSRFIPVTDYAEYYDSGVILAYAKLASNVDGPWTNYVDESMFSGDYGGGRYWAYLHGNAFQYGKDEIKLSAYCETDNIVVDDGFIAFGLENFRLDIKLAFIPGHQVNAMKSREINLSYTQAVAEYLRLR